MRSALALLLLAALPAAQADKLAAAYAREVDKLNAAAQRVLDAPATRQRLAALAAQPMGGPPQALARHLEAEREKYRVLIEGTGIRPE